MIYDNQLKFSDGQAVTVTAASTNVADLELGHGQYGEGYPVFAKVVVGETFTAAGAGTLAISLQDSADDSSFANIASTATLALADLKAGNQFDLALPKTHRRYLRMNYVVGTGPMTAGKVSAFITAAR